MGATVTKPTRPLDAIIMDVLQKVVVPKLDQDVKAIAEDIRQKLVDKIRDDSFNFPESRSPKYTRRKEMEHPGEPPLVATEEYLNSIQVRKTPEGYSVGVGDEVHMGERGKPIPMKKLALALEYGVPSKNIIPRPHWRPALHNLRMRRRNMTQDMKKESAKRGQEALDKYMKENRTRLVL